MDDEQTTGWRVRWVMLTGWIMLLQVYARTQAFGLSSDAFWHQLVLVMLFGVPFGIIALLGVSFRRTLKGLAASVFVAAVLAESFAQVEEFAFRVRCAGVEEVVTSDRWFPIGGHSMLFLPAVEGPLYYGRD